MSFRVAILLTLLVGSFFRGENGFGGHFEMIFPSDVEVVRKGESKSREVHAFPADSYLLSCAKSATSRMQLVDAEGEHRTVYIGGNAGRIGRRFIPDSLQKMRAWSPQRYCINWVLIRNRYSR